jgi:hypothetical protein
MDFDESIDHAKNTITFDGFVRFGEHVGGFWDISHIRIDVYFLDSQRKVIDVRSFFLETMKSTADAIPFKKTFPYDSRYSFFVFGYHVEVST